jgi:UDP-N-acetylmuramate dehydrogenase
MVLKDENNIILPENELKYLWPMEILENFPLVNLNTFHIHVDGRYFTRVASVDEIHSALDFVSERNLPLLILGGGSNILFSEAFPGLVVKVDIKGIEQVEQDRDSVVLRVGAGESWDDLVAYTVEKGFGGLENLSLIPGSVGASPIQNIGAYGVEMKDSFEKLDYFDLENRSIRTMRLPECRFGYRNSIFKQELKNRGVVLTVYFRLTRNPIFKTGYGIIREVLEQKGVKELSLKSMREAVIGIRQSKLPDPADLGNAGSFFKNPTVDEKVHERLRSKFPDLVSFAQENNTYKLAAGWLIDQCGWKGFRNGDAGVHQKQALVLVNYGNATGKELFSLSEKIRESVFETFEVLLEREVNVLPPPDPVHPE